MKVDNDDLRPEYKRSDFPGPFTRGKYAKMIRESSNVIVLKPEVAEIFPNEESVNNALLSLIDLARKSTGISKRTPKRPKKQSAG